MKHNNINQKAKNMADTIDIHKSYFYPSWKTRKGLRVFNNSAELYKRRDKYFSPRTYVILTDAKNIKNISRLCFFHDL